MILVPWFNHTLILNSSWELIVYIISVLSIFRAPSLHKRTNWKTRHLLSAFHVLTLCNTSNSCSLIQHTSVEAFTKDLTFSRCFQDPNECTRVTWSELRAGSALGADWTTSWGPSQPTPLHDAMITISSSAQPSWYKATARRPDWEGLHSLIYMSTQPHRTHPSSLTIRAAHWQLSHACSSFIEGSPNTNTAVPPCWTQANCSRGWQPCPQ